MSYGNATDLTSYATARGVTLSGDEDVLLTLAFDYLESLEFIGQKAEEDQTKEWPRKNAYVDGVELDDTVIPQDIIDSQYAIAIAIDQGNDPAGKITSAIKSETVDTISVEYQDGVSNRTFDPRVFLKLKKYLAAGAGSTNNISVGRG